MCTIKYLKKHIHRFNQTVRRRTLGSNGQRSIRIVDWATSRRRNYCNWPSPGTRPSTASRWLSHFVRTWSSTRTWCFVRIPVLPVTVWRASVTLCPEPCPNPTRRRQRSSSFCLSWTHFLRLCRWDSKRFSTFTERADRLGHNKVILHRD